MDPVKACDLVLFYIKQSILNFHIVESPFSASIKIRKTFIKDKTGIYRTSGFPHFTSSEVFKEEKMVLEAEKDALMKENEALEFQLLSSQKDLANLKADIEHLQSSKKIVEENKNDLVEALEEKTTEIELLKKSTMKQEAFNNSTRCLLEQATKTNKAKENEIVELEAKVEEVSTTNSNLREQVVAKDDELSVAFEEKRKLEEKLESLLDVLYGCPECGLNQCECGDSVEEEKPFEQSSSHPSPPPTLAPQQPPLACSSGSTPWTPPPTPPCISCGGVNIGPSPSSRCIICISPLQKKSPPHHVSSPSRTPPGTPPLMRLETLASKNAIGQEQPFNMTGC